MVIVIKSLRITMWPSALVQLALLGVTLGEVVNPWWGSAVYYRVLVDSFKDGDGDGLGDLQGATKQLSYVKAIGADAVILSSLSTKSPDCTKPGIVDLAGIDQRYGGLEQFVNLMDKAKKLELKVVTTLRLQTVSMESDWFTSSANKVAGFEDWIVWRDGTPDQTPPLEVGIDQWTYHETRNAFFASRGNEPLLNLCSEGLSAALASAQCAWLRRGVAGVVLNPDFMDQGCAVKLARNLVAEAMTCARGSNLETPTILVESALKPDDAEKYYGDGCVGANSVISTALNAPMWSTAPKLALAFYADIYTPQGKTPTWQTSSPDASRTTTRYGSDMTDAINLLTLILPGAAIIQQGDELGAADTILEWATSENCWPTQGIPSAAPFPWDDTANAGFSTGTPWMPLAPNYRYANAKTQYAVDGSHVGVVRVAAAMRKSPAIGPHVETSSPDASRTTTRYGSDMTDAINLLTLILPGAAIIQQGDELGAADTILEWATSENCWPTQGIPSAAPFPWDDTANAGFSTGTPWMPLAPNYRYANAKTQYAVDGSHVGVVRVAAAMRKSPAIGPHVEIIRLGNALAVLRWGGTGSLLVVSNPGKDQAEVQFSRVAGLPAEMTVAASSTGSSFSSGSHVNLEKTVKLGPGETVLLVGPPRHCSGPGPVDKIANKLSEGWQKLNKYFSNL